MDVKNQFKLHEATGEYRVPVLLVGDQVQSGFDSQTLTRALVDAGYIYPDEPEAITVEENTPLDSN